MVDPFLQVILYGVVGGWSLLSNLLIISVFMCNRMLKDTINLLLLSMAINDILVIITGVPLTILNLIQGTHHEISQMLCPYMGYVTLALFVCSVLHLPMIALQRYLSVVKSSFYVKHSTKGKSFIAIVAVWIISFMISLPPLLGWGSIRYDAARFWCFVIWRETGQYLAFVNILCFPIPLGIMIYSYFKVYKYYTQAFKRITARSSGLGHVSEKARIKREQRLTIMLILVVCWFFASFFLYLLGAYGEAFSLFRFPDKLDFAALLLAYCNSIGNFWLYAFMGSKFRKGLKRMCRPRPRGCREVESFSLRSSSMVGRRHGSITNERLINADNL